MVLIAAREDPGPHSSASGSSAGGHSPTSETITSTGPTSIVQPSTWSAVWLLSGAMSCFGPRPLSNQCRRWSITALEALHHIFGPTGFTPVSTSASAGVFGRGSQHPTLPDRTASRYCRARGERGRHGEQHEAEGTLPLADRSDYADAIAAITAAKARSRSLIGIVQRSAQYRLQKTGPPCAHNGYVTGIV
jgi:hypothetical protein